MVECGPIWPEYHELASECFAIELSVPIFYPCFFAVGVMHPKPTSVVTNWRFEYVFVETVAFLASEMYFLQRHLAARHNEKTIYIALDSVVGAGI